MKKNGFTLAEVLITLAIIGVVATLTLPALMNNTAEQQYKTAFKKGLNTLTIAAETNEAIDGFNFSGVSAKSEVNKTEASENTSLYALLATRGSVDYAKSGTGDRDNGNGGTNAMKAKGASTGDAGNFCVYFRDGSVLMFKEDAKGTDDAAKKIEEDGLPHGFNAILDVNGPKLPNALSNCDKDANRSSTQTSTEKKVANCTKANRVIKDRFEVRLRGHYAVPNSAAGRWALEN